MPFVSQVPWKNENWRTTQRGANFLKAPAQLEQLEFLPTCFCECLDEYVRLPDWLNGSIPGLFLFMFYLPDISASGCKHFGGQQPLRPTESLHFQYGRSSWIWCPWAKKPFSSWLCRGPNCFQPILKYCRLFKIPSSLRGHGQISYCINWYVPVRRIFKGLPPMSLNMDSSPLTVLIRKRSGLWVKEAFVELLYTKAS